MNSKNQQCNKESRMIDRYAVLQTLFKPYIWILFEILIVTALGKVLVSIFDLTNIALLFLLPVLFAAVQWGLGPSIFASIIGVLAFDFFFVPPVLAFTVADIRYLLSFAVFLLVAFITGTMAIRLRNQAENAQQRERRTAALYALSNRIVAETEIEKVLNTVVKTVSEIFDGEVFILLPNQKRVLELRATTSSPVNKIISDNELLFVNKLYQSGEFSKKESNVLERMETVYLPLKTEDKILGVLGIRFSGFEQNLSRDQKQLLEAFANLAAIAITKLQFAEEAQQVKYLKESEKLRTALFNSISHDLRTPLASITGAVTGLLEEGDVYDKEAQMALLQTIKIGGQRLNRLVGNLLDMARLESGMLKLNKEWCDLQDILGVALRQAQESWPEFQYHIDIPVNLPLIKIDFSLIELVLMNLLENATKYSTPNSEIKIMIEKGENEVRLAIADRGPGIPVTDQEKIFNEFYRLYSSASESGTGLGLSICKGIIELHGGKIGVKSRPDGGSVFTFFLPLDGLPPGQIPSGKVGVDLNG